MNNTKKEQKKAQKKSLKKQGIVRSMAAMSLYLQTILAPHVVRGVKIPDCNTAPSYPATGVQRVQMVGSTLGAGPVTAGLLLRVGFTGGVATDYYLIQGGAAAGSYNNVGGANKLYGVSLRSVSSSQRPVSAGLFASFQGTTLSDQGRFIVAFIPPGYGGIALPPTTQSDALSLPYLQTFPVKQLYAQSVFLPIDEIARSYTGQGQDGASDPVRGAGRYGYLLILADGLAANQMIEFTFVENYELLPLQNTFSLASPTPSHSDPIELAVATNTIASSPQASVAQPTVTPAEAQAMIPTATTGMSPEKHQHTGMLDTVLGFIDKAIPIGEKVVGAVARAAPLLAAL
jgi:hypothetical protein